MTKQRRSFSDEFKCEAADLVLASVTQPGERALSEKPDADLVIKALAMAYEQRGRPQGLVAGRLGWRCRNIKFQRCPTRDHDSGAQAERFIMLNNWRGMLNSVQA
ncbi:MULTISPECIES: hypothetical protein [unclassified Pseudomonas]|uniref:hypothetical protein n=1 Tax=unclassified Pseudomonas TaxID=196821 RepID=UPI0039B790C0